MALSNSLYKSKSDFDFLKRLRKGGFGAAHLVKPKRNAVTEYVLKEVNLTALDEQWHSDGVSENQRRRLLEKCRNEHVRIKEVIHPNIVQVFDAFEEINDGDHCYFMLMEFCEDGDLDCYLKQHHADPVPEGLIRTWAKQLVGAVCHLHDHGLVHRDIKPKNIFLTASCTKAKLGDFGLAKDLKNKQALQGSFTIAMTHSYASPEQLRNEEADKPSDVWALGITFYEIAHFRRPFDGVAQIINEPPANFDDSRGYSVAFRDFTMYFLEKDPVTRFDIVKLSKDPFLSAETFMPPQQQQQQGKPTPSPSSSIIVASAVDVELIAQSPLIGEPMRSEICRMLQENYVNASVLLTLNDDEIEELVQHKMGLKWELVKWRDVVVNERHQRNIKKTVEAAALIKEHAGRIIDMSKSGDIDELKNLVSGRIVPILQQIVDDNPNSVKTMLAELLAEHVKDTKWHNASPLLQSCYWGHLEIVKFLVEECGSDMTIQLERDVGSMPIHLACQQGHLNVVKWLCDGWPDAMVEARRLDGSTPMHVASSCGHLAIVKYLVHEKQANIEAKNDKLGRTPVFMAVERGHLDLVKYLADDCGASLELRDNGEFGAMPIHLACERGHLHVVRWLCERWPHSAEAQRLDGTTPLHHAAHSGYVDIIKYLVLEKRANYEAVGGKFGRSPVFLAAERGHLNVVKFFVHECKVGWNVREKCEKGSMPIHLACEKGHLEIVEWFCNQRPDLMVEAERLDGATPLHVAALHGRLEIVRYLVHKKRANVEAAGGKFGRTPVFWAAQKDHFNVVKFLAEECNVKLNIIDKGGKCSKVIHLACSFGNLKVVAWLCERWPDLAEAKRDDGSTPIHLAASHGHLEIVKHLALSKRANVEAVAGKFERTPVFFATENGHLKVVEFLVEQCNAKFDIRETVKKGSMPIHLACEKGHLKIVEWFCDRRPDLMVEAKRLDGATPLHVAALHGRLEIVRYLVREKRANVEAVGGKFGRTPLFIAAQEGHLDVVKFLVEECKANLDIQEQDKDGHGWFIVHLAAALGHVSVVEYLVYKRPAFLEIKAKNGKTPLQIANEAGRAEVVSLISMIEENTTSF